MEAPGLFQGIRILELGAGAAGPVATRYFADQGATVVRIESSRRPDFLRLIHARPGDPHGLDGSPMFVLMNPNKKSICIDMSKPEGVTLARRLVGWADVVSENFSPKVMAKWGLDYESLRAEFPDLVMVSSCLFGQTGPERMYPGFGGQGSAIAGFNHLTGWPDRGAVGPHGTITDSLSPRYVALLIAAALLHRRRTGEGQYIDVSQIETGVYSLSECMLRYSGNGEVMVRDGNACEDGAPHGIYPCRGEDRWIAIACFSDLDWRRLVRALGDPGRLRTPRFSTLAGRLEAREELERELSEETRDCEAYELMGRLQAQGIEAGVVQTYEDLLRDPQLAHRGHFQVLRHRRLGELRFERQGLRPSAGPPRLLTPGPDLGQHTREILEELLGLAPKEIAELERREILV